MRVARGMRAGQEEIFVGKEGREQEEEEKGRFRRSLNLSASPPLRGPFLTNFNIHCTINWSENRRLSIPVDENECLISGRTIAGHDAAWQPGQPR